MNLYCQCRNALIQKINLICWLWSATFGICHYLQEWSCLAATYSYARWFESCGLFAVILTLKECKRCNNSKNLGFKWSWIIFWGKEGKKQRNPSLEWFLITHLVREWEQWRGRQTTIKGKGVAKRLVSMLRLWDSWAALSLLVDLSLFYGWWVQRKLTSRKV